MISFKCAHAANFFNRKCEGWHWYERKRQEELKLTPEQEFTVMKSQSDQALHSAILNPTTENVLNYLKLQEILLTKSYNFAHKYREVVQLNPEFNGTIHYPTSQIGTHIYHDIQRQDRDKALHEATRKYGLFYFYRSDCPYCQKFDSILKMFVEKYKFVIKPIVLDASLPIIGNLQVKAVPALFFVDPATNETQSISFGFVALDELIDRVYFILKSKNV